MGVVAMKVGIMALFDLDGVKPSQTMSHQRSNHIVYKQPIAAIHSRQLPSRVLVQNPVLSLRQFVVHLGLDFQLAPSIFERLFLFRLLFGVFFYPRIHAFVFLREEGRLFLLFRGSDVVAFPQLTAASRL